MYEQTTLGVAHQTTGGGLVWSFGWTSVSSSLMWPEEVERITPSAPELIVPSPTAVGAAWFHDRCC